VERKVLVSKLKYILAKIKALFKIILKPFSIKGLKWYWKIPKIVMNSLILVLIFAFLVNINFLWLFGRTPSVDEVYNPDQNIASELYSADGKLIGKFFNENRVPVKLNEVSPIFVKVLINTEDVRFYEHHGVDMKATFAIFWSMFKGEKRGGSTLTQQLVKNMYKTRAKDSRGLLGHIPLINTVVAKIKEVITSVKIEMNYSKDEILLMYLNTVDFGNNTFGIKTAAKTYFNKKPSLLNIQESAVLVGLLKAPTYYNPLQNKKNSLKRRNAIFQQLAKNEIITKKGADSLSKIPIELDYNVEENYDGEAIYFRQSVANYLKKWLKENKIDLYGDGIKIYTTLDSRMQKYAEEATQEHMKSLQKRFFNHWDGENPWRNNAGVEIPNFLENEVKKGKQYAYLTKKFNANKDSIDYYLNVKKRMTVFTWRGEKDTTLSTMDSLRYYKHILQAGFLAMEPQTGYVKAWVGGPNFNYFKYDHVRQFKRQPGSTFKAFVYAAAMELNGWAPCDMIKDEAATINYVEKGVKKSWTPSNAEGVYSGRTVTLKNAFARSINSVSVQLTNELGWRKVIEIAHKLGITSTLADVPSICLGSSDVSLYELLAAYCPLVNEGYRADPVLVTKITDRKGKILFEYKPKKERVLTYETSFLMTQLLLGGLSEPGGTTGALWEHKIFDWDTDFGGKTGTSSQQSDGWFVGVTPNLIAGVWVGNDDRSIHFRNMDEGEGCKTATPIFGKFFERLLPDDRFTQYRGRFPKKPKEKIKRSYMCHTRATKKDKGDSEESETE
jgi:penicillin-binding protein 1A